MALQCAMHSISLASILYHPRFCPESAGVSAGSASMRLCVFASVSVYVSPCLRPLLYLSGSLWSLCLSVTLSAFLSFCVALSVFLCLFLSSIWVYPSVRVWAPVSLSPCLPSLSAPVPPVTHPKVIVRLCMVGVYGDGYLEGLVRQVQVADPDSQLPDVVPGKLVCA